MLALGALNVVYHFTLLNIELYNFTYEGNNIAVSIEIEFGVVICVIFSLYTLNILRAQTSGGLIPESHTTTS